MSARRKHGFLTSEYSDEDYNALYVYCAPPVPGDNPWPYAIRANLCVKRLRSPSSVPQRLAHSPISTEVKSTEVLSGGRALTARRTGRWLRRALRYPRLSAVRRPHPCRWCLLV